MKLIQLYLILSLIVLPVSYAVLCGWMNRKVINPPKLPFFFIFGTVGGYILLLICGPSFLSMLVFVPFIILAFLNLLWSLIICLTARPFSKFHGAAIALSCILISCILLSAFSPFNGGVSYAGSWDDDSGNWGRAFGGQEHSSEVVVIHSRYWRSPHFTYESEYFFEFTAPAPFLDAWITEQKLVLTKATEENTPPFFEKPDWFTPKSLEQYEMWLPADEPDGKFRIYRDRSTGTVFVTDCST